MTVFLDTSGWFAALSPVEAHHREAIAAYTGWIEAGTSLVTTNLVVAEMQTLLSRYRGPAEALRFLDSLYQDTSHEVVFVTRDMERDAVNRWLRAFGDKRLSLTDSVSFEVMRTRKIQSVLTLDAHFTHAGYQAVPRMRGRGRA